MMIKNYVRKHKEDVLELIRELCSIPAPSFHEEKRAAFCKSWLEAAGAEGVYIDEVKNVIFPIGCEGSNEITVFSAHTDTVFPDMEPMELKEDDEKIYCPGVGDDTASVAVLLYVAKFFIENHIKPKKGVLIVYNSCEEGLGNLVGTRHLMKSFEGRIKQFIPFDSHLHVISSRCVGSHRYEVEVTTEGGHSFQAFGKKNAIAELSKIVAEIYKIVPPTREGIRTTYNVGIIEGGTSVNTIAQSAKMLCEYRSDDVEYLEMMRQKFAEIFENANSDEVSVKVTQIGERPCADVDLEKQDALAETCREIIEGVLERKTIYKSASTDCNIPLSMGVPAVCVGVFQGEGSHTREEYIEKEEMEKGLEIGLRLALELTK